MLGPPKEFLGLTEAEADLIETRLAPARRIKSDGSPCGSHPTTWRSIEIQPVSDREADAGRPPTSFATIGMPARPPGSVNEDVRISLVDRYVSIVSIFGGPWLMCSLLTLELY